MSSPRSIIINCGATHVGVAVFSNNPGNLVLERYHVEELDYDYAGEDAWLGALAVSLGGIVRALKLSGPASVIVPGYQLLTKSIRVPQVEKAKQAQIIGFEAQNQIPYPLNEVVWDSQIISTDGVEAEVMLFALKQDAASRIAGVVSAAGLTPSTLEASTILDYQAWRAASPDNTEDVLIVNIGARTTNMTFVNASGFTVHNVNVGGNFLTQSISDALAQPFRTAEALKVAYFSGQRHLNDFDKHAAALQQQAESFMRRVSQELTRRIVIYKRQNQNSQPKRIILTGRGSLLPGLSEHLCETQRISVDYFDPFPAFAASSAVDAEFLSGSRVRLSEILGEAVRGGISGSVGVNLLPAALESEISFNKLKPLLVATAALLAIAPWPVYLHYATAGTAAKTQISGVESRASALSGYKSELGRIKDESASVAARLEGLHDAVAARDNWREFLSDVQARLARVPDTWVEEIHFKRTDKPAGAEGEAAETGKVTLGVRMLLKDVPPTGDFNGGAFNARRTQVLKALQASPFVSRIPKSAEKADLSKANLPRLTLTLVTKQDQKPL